jgi:XTP/dITP diphosphohydrolase
MTEQPTLLVATHNKGKVATFAEMMSDMDINWLSLDDLGITMEVDETGKTFMDNAILKAVAYARAAGVLTLTDDSGLEVKALGGAPGVKTARYGGPGLSSKERYEYLLSQMVGIPLADRGARFVCAIALAGVDGEILATSTGTVDGVIALQPSGEGGFGYDPVFYLPEAGATYAEMSLRGKRATSHRGRAMRAIEPQLREILAGS